MQYVYLYNVIYLNLNDNYDDAYCHVTVVLN